MEVGEEEKQWVGEKELVRGKQKRKWKYEERKAVGWSRKKGQKEKRKRNGSGRIKKWQLLGGGRSSKRHEMKDLEPDANDKSTELHFQ